MLFFAGDAAKMCCKQQWKLPKHFETDRERLNSS
jgi:hypothetical protein